MDGSACRSWLSFPCVGPAVGLVGKYGPGPGEGQRGALRRGPTVGEASYCDSATLGEVRATHPLAVVEAVARVSVEAGRP
jgi:hypothetical protein